MRWRLSFLVSASCHVLLFVALFWVGFPEVFSPIRPLFERNFEIIEAVTVDERKVQAEFKKLEKGQQKQKKEEKAVIEVQKKRVIEEKRLEELKKQQVIETKKLEELKKQKQKEEEEREEKAREQEEAKKKEEAAKKAEAEALRRSAERARALQGKVDHYKTIVQQKIENFWIKPSQWQGLSCTLRIKILPGGVVGSVEVIQGSGSLAFDDSAVRAAYKASPLPIPSEPDVWSQFRDLKLLFKPQ